ncbi:MAG: hypothetical protein BZY88_00930 [SAR202 cluster bacterium Io17-Chloro-G9]|nr:MAG: hypothetical protein BZY88_00930 [SAR202 cluster bacterium Io17-Chloro-G9]
MSFLTGLALKRPTVTALAILLILSGGIFTFRNLERELFPEIEFPNITIVTAYPSANPDAVVRDVTEEIEDAIKGMSGLRETQSVSSENASLVLATFEFGEDMEEAERTIISNLNGIDFPEGVEDPLVSRIANDIFPVLQVSVLGDRDIPSLQRLVDDVIVPVIEGVPGVFRVDVIGRSDEQVLITLDIDKLEDLGLSASQVATALRENNLNFPAGSIDDGVRSYPVRTSHQFGSLDEISNSIIGFESDGARMLEDRPIRVADIAQVEMGTAKATVITRTNRKPSLNIAILKDPDANTVSVTEEALKSLGTLQGLPPDVEIIVLTNDGPEVRAQLDTLLREGLLGFLFAISVVFAFLVNPRLGLVRGTVLTLRPTAIIGFSIPLSILTGVLIMGFTGLSLNFMTLAGLAIAVGRVVDDSIVVLENIYRHLQMGEDRLQAATEGTREVGAAIVSSTLTTVVVFIPLAFIQGLVGAFFSPFAMSVSFALLASTLVALTAVPVLGLFLLRPGDFPEPSDDQSPQAGDTVQLRLLQRVYSPALLWALRHKMAAILAAVVITVASLGLTFIIPVTLFPAGAPEFITIDVELPTGTSVARTFREVRRVEDVLSQLEDQGFVEAYQVTLGAISSEFGPGTETGGFHLAGIIVRMAEDVPTDITGDLRARLPSNDDATITINAISGGPPTDELEITVSGSNFTAIADVAKRLESELSTLTGLVNVSSDVSEAREEVVINVDPQRAGEYRLTANAVAHQVNRYLVGQTVSEADLEDITLDVVLRGNPEDVDNIEKLQSMNIESPLGLVKLGTVSQIAMERGPVSISRFDGDRSATITGGIVTADTQAVGREVQAKIESLGIPPGIQVRTGGIFQQIAEGFEDVFTAMAVGVILVYLVMVASLGSLRNPLVIVLSLPLAVVGALAALAITDRTLSLSALMGLLLLIGVVVTNAIVLLTFVEQLREQGMPVYDALIEGARVRLRPILMTAFTTIFALLPLAMSSSGDSGIIGVELATVVIGGLISSTFLTLIVVPVVYTLAHDSIPNGLGRLIESLGRFRPWEVSLSSQPSKRDGT